MGSFCINITAVLHFRPDQVLVKVVDNTRSPVLPGALQATDHFPCMFSDAVLLSETVSRLLLPVSPVYKACVG